MKYRTEHEAYPDIKKYFERRGWFYLRIEGNISIPDIFICKGDDWYWTEVKMYRGSKNLHEVTADDLKWQPGQLRFRNDMIRCGNKKNYLLIICNGDDFFHVYGGLGRCL